MLKHLLLISIYLNCFITEAQTVRFQLQRERPCDNTSTIDSFDFYLTDHLSDSIYSPPYKKETGVLTLPGIGKYRLFTYDIDPKSDAEIEILDTGLFIYKIIEPKIVYRTYNVLHPPSYYKICGRLAEGYAEDFYPNGNLRIRGNFLKGEPKDSIVWFYQNAAVQRRVLYSRNKVIVQSYDSSNHLIKVRKGNRIHNPYMTPGKDIHYEITEYFTTGKIKRIESKTGYNIIFKEYYSNGKLKVQQAKNSFKEYYENGGRKIVCTWKLKKDASIDSYSYIIHKTLFDKNGNIAEKQIYEQFKNFDHPVEYQPETEILASDWIIKWIKLEKGKTISIAEDMNPEDYLKSHPD